MKRMTFTNYYKTNDTEVSTGINRGAQTQIGEFTVDGTLFCARGCGAIKWRMFPTRAAWYDQGVFVKRKDRK